MKVGFCCGCFDGLHRGHQHFLLEAMCGCDHLIVALNADWWCKVHKGPGRPLYPLVDRIWKIQEFCGRRAAVVPFDGGHKALIDLIQPDVIFAGFDQSDDYGSFPVKRIDELPGYSTTLLANMERAFK